MAKNDKGGNLLWVAFIDPSTYAVLTSYTLNTNCGLVSDVSDSDTSTPVTETDYKSEDGIIRDSDSSRVAGTTATMMDREKAKTDFFSFALLGQTCLQGRFTGLVGGKYNEEFAICKPQAQYNVKTPGGTSSGKYQSKFIAPNAAVTYTSGAIALIAAALGITIHATSISIAANREYAVVET